MGERVLVSEEVARHAVEVMDAAEARIAELEAKLATAVGALERIEVCSYADSDEETIARQALRTIQERT